MQRAAQRQPQQQPAHARGDAQPVGPVGCTHLRMALEPGRVQQRERRPAHQRHQRQQHALPVRGSRLATTGLRHLGHQRQARHRQQQAGQQGAPAQPLRLAQQHHPERNRADDERRHRRARMPDGECQEQVVAREAQHRQPERRARLPQRGPQRLAAQAPEQHAQCHGAIGDEPAGRQVSRRESLRHVRRDEHQPPERACGEPCQDAGEHQSAKPSSAAMTAPLTKWLWSLASMTIRASRSCGSPRRLRGSMSTSLRP